MDLNTIGPIGPEAMPVSQGQQDVDRQTTAGVSQFTDVTLPGCTLPTPAKQSSRIAPDMLPSPLDTSSDNTKRQEFAQWLTSAGLTQSNQDKLIQGGFISKTSLELLDIEDCDVLRIVPLIQQKILMRLKGSFSRNMSPSKADAPNLGSNSDLNAQLSTLFANIKMPGVSQEAAAGENKLPVSSNRVDLNPLSYLLPKQKVKYLDIADFVQAMGQALSQEDVLGEAQGGQIIFKTGPKKIQLEQVLPMQWSAANMRIMVELLRTGMLKDTSILDYISYTVKVSELADTYTWGSVLHYDRAYRILQSQNSFRWGSDSPHLDALHLRSRIHQFSGHNIKGQASNLPQQNPTNISQGFKGNYQRDQVCRLYQRNACPFGLNCRFRHRCSAPNCGENHPLASHGRPSLTQSKNQ